MPSKPKDIICPNPKCKEDINKPIILTDLSKTPAESYYACPRCMTKIDVVSETQEVQDMVPITAQEIPEEKGEETSEVVEPQRLTEEKPARPPEPKEETPPECPHYFGYLTKRPKDASIPEECLTCRKMIKCMLRL